MKLTTKIMSVVAVLALGLAGGVNADDTGELFFFSSCAVLLFAVCLSYICPLFAVSLYSLFAVSHLLFISWFLVLGFGVLGSGSWSLSFGVLDSW